MSVMRGIGAVLAGIVVGSIVNMGLLNLGGVIIPPPEGADTSDMEKLKESMHLFEARHFVFPFLAHALGTLVGALVAAKIATVQKMRFALGIGIWFLLGGIAVAFMLPAPAWFNALDLIVAYIPMGILGGRLATRGS